MAASQWRCIPYKVHYYWQGPIVHYEGNGIPFRTQYVSLSLSPPRCTASGEIFLKAYNFDPLLHSWCWCLFIISFMFRILENYQPPLAIWLACIHEEYPRSVSLSLSLSHYTEMTQLKRGMLVCCSYNYYAMVLIIKRLFGSWMLIGW